MAIFNGYKSKAEAHRYLASEGFNFGSAISKPESNPKVFKNQLQGVLSSPLHLAPWRLSGFNTCADASEGCKEACLNTAGNPVYAKGKERARRVKTQAYFKARAAFMAVVCFELEALEIKAKRVKMQGAFRPNATSDIAFELVQVKVNNTTFDNIMQAFPNLEFYDYSKSLKRALKWARGLMPSNYHITFSKSESNDDKVSQVLQAGGNVAVVFEKALPATYLGKQVINGDLHDFRPLDNKGVVVGLKAKGKAKTDLTGFTVRGLTTKLLGEERVDYIKNHFQGVA
jgi:hypothetical protein